MDQLARFILFHMRHGIACAVSIGLFTGVLTGAYFLVLLFAILFGGGTGSPLLIVLVPLCTFLLSTTYSFFFLLPATALTEWLLPGTSLKNLLLQVPLTILMLYLVCFVGGVSLGAELQQAAGGGFVIVFILALPLGLYWWILKGVDAGLWPARRLVGWLHRKWMAGELEAEEASSLLTEEGEEPRG